jgi:hypothetical protein
MKVFFTIFKKGGAKKLREVKQQPRLRGEQKLNVFTANIGCISNPAELDKCLGYRG